MSWFPILQDGTAGMAGQAKKAVHWLLLDQANYPCETARAFSPIGFSVSGNKKLRF